MTLNLNTFYFDESKEHIGLKFANLSELALKIENNKVTYRGLMHEVIQSIAKIVNFTTHYRIYDGEFLYVQNSVNFHKTLIISTEKFGNLANRTYFGLHFSIPFAKEEYYYTVTPNDLYTNYEKLTMPFDGITWILLILTFGLTFGLIFMINIYYKWLRTIVCGEGIKMPAYNALGIFFGIGQTRLPRHYFSRLILLLFIWFCLIIRTCYQSMLFEFMTSDMRKPLPESIDDLIKWNYTIVVHDATHLSFAINHQIIGENSTVEVLNVSDHEFYDLYKKALNGKNTEKFAFFTSHTIHKIISSEVENSLSIMDEENEKFSMLLVLEMSNNDILFSHLDYVMQNFVSNGIAKHLVDYAMWFLSRPYDVEIEDTRRILSMNDLEFGFVIWLVACFVAFLAFIYEIFNLFFKRKFRNILRNIFGLFEFLKVLKARMNEYHDKW
ncbi:hypothetical protein PVAND_014823 [Polypedilum vanderplanki]|uniref:Ionotropic receptor n=1 Tax=Polypedilum vanderplanki TaxID=319348 RepID=A0A9J6BAU9_POLVA|nr:hypothetical protein PVAND_014823 [Polypedilum vanderplanki]